MTAKYTNVFIFKIKDLQTQLGRLQKNTIDRTENAGRTFRKHAWAFLLQWEHN